VAVGRIPDAKEVAGMNMRSEYTEEPEKGGLSPKAIVAIVLGVLALVFVLQNTDSHKVNLLFWDARLPSWLWLLAYFVVYTIGELFILPTGLGLFARLAPPSLGATTVAAWFLAIFTGSMSAGVVGTLWSRVSHPVFFVLLAAIASVAAALLLALDRETRRIERERAAEIAAAGALVEPIL